MTIPDRSQWLRSLMSLPAEVVINAVKILTADWQIKPKALSQSGLGMMKLRDGAFHEPFYLGEIPVATAWLEILTPDGETCEGAAQIMDDSSSLAETLALCDAILANRLSGWEQIADLVDQGMAQIQEQTRIRKAMLDRSRVNFSLLDAAGGEEDAY